MAARGCDEGGGIQNRRIRRGAGLLARRRVSSATAALALRAEMKLPGEALLEFRIEALNDRQCVLRQSALFRPRGLFGLVYWYSVLPFHAIVFRGMLKGIEREALKIASQSPEYGFRKFDITRNDCGELALQIHCWSSAFLG